MTYQSEAEFKQLLDHFKNLTPRRNVLEIGSLHGETLIEWMNNMGPGGTIISIDCLVPQSDPRYKIQNNSHNVMWHLWARDRVLDFFCLNSDSKDPYAISQVGILMPSIDFLFIDGGHDYETCKSDWDNYSPLVRPGGMVAFHDLGAEWPGVRPVWEMARKGHKNVEIVESPNQWGIGVLWK